MSFPDDLLREILLKLPSLKSTVRLSCVCKSWRHLITKDPLFRDELFNRIDPKCADDPLMVFYKDPNNRYYQIRTHSSKNSFGRLNFSSDLYGIVGSCNGIICLRQLSACKSKYLIRLYNPITREYRKLPPSSIPHWFHQGFGIDSSRNDFKVVSILGKNKAEVYKLSTNCWSEVSLNLGFTLNLDCLSQSSVYVNGRCYWRLFGEMILTFDFQTETFGFINLPTMEVRNGYHGLGVRDNSLALCIFTTDQLETKIEVYIEEECGNSWIRKFCVRSVDLISCWVHDTKLYQLKSSGEVVALGISEEEDDEMEEVEEEDYAKTGLFWYAWPHFRSIVFKPSLVSLRSGRFVDL